MVRRITVLLAGVVLAISLSGCGLFGSSDEEPTTLTGSWAGTFTAQGTEYRIEMDLQQLEGVSTVFGGETVQGGGTLRGSGEEYAFNVSGTVAEKSVSMNLNYDDGRPGNFVSGTVSDNFSTVRGELVGGPADLDRAEVTLERR